MDGQRLVDDGKIAFKDKLTYTFTVTETTNIGILIKAYDGVYRIKLEKGDFASDWTSY